MLEYFYKKNALATSCAFLKFYGSLEEFDHVFFVSFRE